MSNSETWIAIGIVEFLVLFYVPPVLYFKFGWFKKFYHDFLEWHRPEDKQSFDGCSFHSKCKWCGEEILQDSQGNWFSIETDEETKT